MSESKPKFEWTGWVLAYANVNGPILTGWLGRMVTKHHEQNVVVLEDAIEFSSIQRSQGGNITRTIIGSPIEFSTITKIEVVYVGLIELGELGEEALRPFTFARTQAGEQIRHVQTGRPLIQVPHT